MTRKRYEICYRKLNSTLTDVDVVYAPSKNKALQQWHIAHPYNMVLACRNESGENLGVL